jgi:hypothetical protein
MRALLLLPVALALLGGSAMASCDARLCVSLQQPGPGAHVNVYEDSSCAIHQVFWEGAWMSVANATVWAASGGQAFPADHLDDGAGAAFAVAWNHAWGALNDGLPRVPGWLFGDPTQAVFWANDQVGHEDDCALSFVDAGLGP